MKKTVRKSDLKEEAWQVRYVYKNKKEYQPKASTLQCFTDHFLVKIDGDVSGVL